MSKQIAAMRARFRTYSEYAAVPFQDMMRADELKDALILKCTHLESSYLENIGNGQFKIRVLPLEAQFAPLFGMLVEDFTSDGFLDVLCVGNSFSTEVNTGRYDAQGGLLLRGDGKGQFTADRKSFNILGDHKSISQLEVGNQRVIVVGANSDKLKVLKINELQPKKMQPIQALDQYALMTHPNGKTSKQEFYYGNSYLSQQVRKLAMDTACQKIQIFNHQQKSRIIHDKQK
jgi:hypothetical protein